MCTQGPIVTNKAVVVSANPAMELVYTGDFSTSDEVVTADRSALISGGKATNVARSLKTRSVLVCSTPYESGLSALYIDHLRQTAEMRFRGVPALESLRFSVVLVDDANPWQTRIVRTAGEADPGAWTPFVAAVDEETAAGDVVVMSGSQPASWPDSTYRKIVETAHLRAARTAIDCTGGPLREALVAKPTLVKINRAEASIALGLTDQSVDHLAAELVDRGAESAVVTDGPSAFAFADRSGRAETVEPRREQPLAPTGAGDAFLASLVEAMMMRSGALDLQALERAAAAGAAAVRSLSSGVVDLPSVGSTDGG